MRGWIANDRANEWRTSAEEEEAEDVLCVPTGRGQMTSTCLVAGGGLWSGISTHIPELAGGSRTNVFIGFNLAKWGWMELVRSKCEQLLTRNSSEDDRPLPGIDTDWLIDRCTVANWRQFEWVSLNIFYSSLVGFSCYHRLFYEFIKFIVHLHLGLTE